MKIDKIAREEFSAQAACRDVLMNNVLIAESARAARIPVPLLEECRALYEDVVNDGDGELDMAAAIFAFKRRAALAPEC